MSVRPEWNDFARWLLLTNEERKGLSLPTSEAAYATAKGVSDRQLRRWKTDPIFQGLLEKLRTKQLEKAAVSGISAISVNGVEAELEGEESPASAEDEYQAIKSKLVKGAMSGDAKYLDLYFRTYGKDFVAEEAAARTSDLASMDFDTLIAEALANVNLESIAEYLRGLGYVVALESEYNQSTSIESDPVVESDYYYTGEDSDNAIN